MNKIAPIEKELTVKQLKAISQLLLGKSVSEAAREADCNPHSIFRWQKLPAFRAKLEEGKELSFNLASDKLLLGVSTAVDRLQSLIEDDEVPPSVQVRAAEIIISQALKIREMADLQKRIEVLEVRLINHV